VVNEAPIGRFEAFCLKAVSNTGPATSTAEKRPLLPPTGGIRTDIFPAYAVILTEKEDSCQPIFCGLGSEPAIFTLI
jgi:hypothetical protein